MCQPFKIAAYACFYWLVRDCANEKASGRGDLYVAYLMLPISWYDYFSEYIQIDEAGDISVTADDVKVVWSLSFHFCQFPLQLPQRNSKNFCGLTAVSFSGIKNKG